MPLDMRSLFQSIAGRLRKGAPELQECIQKLATSPQNADKMVLVPEDRAHLVNMVLAADNPGELEVKFSAEPVVSVGQPDVSSATVQRLNERIEAMGHRIGITALAMAADNDRLIEAARSIEALLENRYADVVNKHMIAAGNRTRFDPRSYADAGITDVVPERKAGYSRKTVKRPEPSLDAILTHLATAAC